MTTQDVALPSDYDTGLEDFDPASAGLPRVHIKHADGVFIDKQTNEEFPVIYGVFLGMIKQRVMWAKDLEEDSKPLCKSNDGEWGYPNVTGPRHSLFPWAASGLDMNVQPRDENGRVTIKCETCPFTQWNRANGKNTAPPCSERFTMPMHFTGTEGAALDHAGLISFQRSGITPIKNYIAAFSRTKQPLFSSYFTLRLDMNKRGQVVYSVPKISRGGPVPENQWGDYATEYRSVREALRRPPMFVEDEPDGSTASNNSWGPGGAPATQQPVEATVVTGDPWETNVTQGGGAQGDWPPAQPATVPAQPLMGGGLIDAASTPIASPAAPTQPAQASVPAASAPVNAVASTADDDDLPF